VPQASAAARLPPRSLSSRHCRVATSMHPGRRRLSGCRAGGARRALRLQPLLNHSRCGRGRHPLAPRSCSSRRPPAAQPGKLLLAGPLCEVPFHEPHVTTAAPIRPMMPQKSVPERMPAAAATCVTYHRKHIAVTLFCFNQQAAGRVSADAGRGPGGRNAADGAGDRPRHRARLPAAHLQVFALTALSFLAIW